MFESFNRMDSSRPFSASKGNQTKYHIGNLWYKEDYLGYEAASEYLCSQILAHSNAKAYVDYTIVDGTANETTVHYCASEHFLGKGEQIHTLHDMWEKIYGRPYFKAMERLSTKERIEATVQFLEDVLHMEHAGEELTFLLEFDAFVLNEDRHSNNIAFIEAADGTFRFTPIFDNGAAFLSDTTNYSMQLPPQRLVRDVKAKPFSVHFEKQVAVAETLYGRQLELYPMDIEPAFEVIKEHYGILIANRMKRTYQWQKSTCKDLFLEDAQRSDMHGENIDRDEQEEDFER